MGKNAKIFGKIANVGRKPNYVFFDFIDFYGFFAEKAQNITLPFMGTKVQHTIFFVLLVNDLLTKDNETLTKVNETLTKVNEQLTKVNES